ncbi:MAG: serine/threonine protein phosphatase [Thalassobius sp.]|nr:serine/threonine protein phosphatase [Thalassovita sp.]
MKLRRIHMQRLAVFLAAISWIFLLGIAMIEQYRFSHLNIMEEYVPISIEGALLNSFIVFTYIFLWLQSRKNESQPFHNLIWKVFLTGMVCTLFSGVLSLASSLVGISGDTQKLVSIFTFRVDFGLLTIFLLTTFNTWKRMILYEKTRYAVIVWFLFEIALFSTLTSHFFQLTESESILINVFRAVFFIMIMLLSVNLKWVPHLVFNQKITSVFQLLVSLFCLAYFFANIISYYDDPTLQIEDYSENIFYSVLSIFIIIYGISSLLVILFNLPTSSVFEKKLKELSIFQELSSEITEGKNDNQIYKMLLESASSSVSADASWLEVHQQDVFLYKDITKEDTYLIKKEIYQAGYNEKKLKIITKRRLLPFQTKSQYNSILAVPLISGDEYLGIMVLLKKLTNAFDNTMISMVNTFSAQAGIAIQNFKLISQVVESERYKNELEIAKAVQERLLPEKLQVNGTFEFFAKSKPATEVGGDYYDLHRLSEHEYVVIIADVAGKGISAAFNMAQMKGIFQGLVRLNLNPDEFLIKANAALTSCLERSAFITASYFHINTETFKIRYARAGHCPTLFYRDAQDKVEYLETDGLGLGIIRNESYKNYVSINEISYQKNDIMMLYTDGIVEAQNTETKEIYGFERLHDYFENNHDKSIENIGNTLISNLNNFTNAGNINDDFTILLIKF